MMRFIDKIREELEKDDVCNIDVKACLSFLDRIEDDYLDIDFEKQELEDEIHDLVRQIDNLESELEEYKSNQKIETLDDIFKQEIFSELSKKYTSYNLEELLKSNGIM